ncbi:MAG: drug/metabolite transporter (DMT)-like permease [Verrucomicrobiales bacterium]|jgi:drug/metabolite transporter (DMT)-like permease
MRFTDALRLLLLAIIWGASFLLMRIAAPEFGPVPLILCRSLIAAICFAGVFRLAANRVMLRKHLGDFFLLGIVNTALPFSLLAYSTLSLEAGFTSLLNATTPMFAAIIGAAIYSTPLRKPQVLGLVIALAGVTVLSWDSLSFKPGGSGLAVISALIASASYGVAVNFTKHRLADVPPQVVSAGALVMASAILLIPGIWLWPETMPSAKAFNCTLLLGVVCTAVAYALFFRLLKHTGAMAASSVTFLIPVFAILWGASVLGEKVDPQLLTGMIITLLGTALTIGLIGRRKNA